MQSISTNHHKSVSIDAGILCMRAGKRMDGSSDIGCLSLARVVPFLNSRLVPYSY